MGGLSALAGILGTPYGIYVAGAVGLVAAVGFFFAKSAFKDWKFKNDETRAGAKAGSEASTGQEKLNKNRDQVDDFFGRDRRS